MGAAHSHLDLLHLRPADDARRERPCARAYPEARFARTTRAHAVDGGIVLDRFRRVLEVLREPVYECEFLSSRRSSEAELTSPIVLVLDFL